METDINGQLSSAWFQRGTTCLGTALNVNVNVNLYSASSQKAPLMRSSLGQHMHINGLRRASSRPPPRLLRYSLKRCDVPVSRCRHRGPRSSLTDIIVVR